jgi:hypothetical protein
MRKTENGHGVMTVMMILVVVGIIAGAFFFIKSKNDSSSDGTSASGNSKAASADEPPVKIKHIGINLAPYDPKTNKAGDIVFTKDGLSAYGNILFFEYGALAEANSAAQARLNPQPTFIIPLGTPIHSLIDGVVVKIEKLYSNDYSVMVATDKKSQWIYELEHVINPKVKEGDKVKAGQVVAEASTHDSQYHPGFGLYEIGILHAGNPPEHVCIFNYLDDSIKTSTLNNIRGLYSSWEAYMGDTTLYDEAKAVVPGCQTLAPVGG